MFVVSCCSGMQGTKPGTVSSGFTHSFAFERFSNLIFIHRKVYFQIFTQMQKSTTLSHCEGFSLKREKSGGTSSSLPWASAGDRALGGVVGKSGGHACRCVNG